jgi:hypothetical protein
MEGEPDYAAALLAWMSILTERRWQWMILMVNRPRGACIVVVLVLGEGEGGRWSSELCFGCFCVVDLLNSYVECSIKMCMYVDNNKFELTP